MILLLLPRKSFKCFVSFYSKDLNKELCDEWIKYRAFSSQLGLRTRSSSNVANDEGIQRAIRIS